MVLRFKLSFKCGKCPIYVKQLPLQVVGTLLLIVSTSHRMLACKIEIPLHIQQ